MLDFLHHWLGPFAAMFALCILQKHEVENLTTHEDRSVGNCQVARYFHKRSGVPLLERLFLFACLSFDQERSGKHASTVITVFITYCPWVHIVWETLFLLLGRSSFSQLFIVQTLWNIWNKSRLRGCSLGKVPYLVSRSASVLFDWLEKCSDHSHDASLLAV